MRYPLDGSTILLVQFRLYKQIAATKTREGNMNTSELESRIYQVELQLKKLHILEQYQLHEQLPDQRKRAKEACTDLIDLLTTYTQELEPSPRGD